MGPDRLRHSVVLLWNRRHMRTRGFTDSQHGTEPSRLHHCRHQSHSESLDIHVVLRLPNGLIPDRREARGSREVYRNANHGKMQNPAKPIILPLCLNWLRKSTTRAALVMANSFALSRRLAHAQRSHLAIAERQQVRQSWPGDCSTLPLAANERDVVKRAVGVICVTVTLRHLSL